MCGARTVSRETFRGFKIGEEIHWYRSQTHNASVARLIRVWQAGIRVPFTLKPTKRANHRGPNVEAGPSAAEVAVVGPLTVTTHLINRIEAAFLDQAGRQTECHGRIISPLTRK